MMMTTTIMITNTMDTNNNEKKKKKVKTVNSEEQNFYLNQNNFLIGCLNAKRATLETNFLFSLLNPDNCCTVLIC